MKAFTFLLFLACTLEVFPQGWITLNSGTDFPINDIYFVNESTGWFVSHYGLIKKTTDGGQTWTIQTSSSQSELKAIQFLDINNGYIIGGSGTVFKTTNSGENWVQLSTGYTGYFYGIDFISREIGWIVGSDGKILKTTDGGLNWTNQSPINNETFFDIDFIDENIGNVVGTGGKIYRSNLGGIDWFPQESGTISNGFNAVSLVDAAHGWIGGYHVKKTTNGGTNWVDLLYSFTNDVFFVNRNFGVITTNNGNVYITSNGGGNFFSIPTGTNQDIRCAFFKSENLGWIGGSGGLILKYVDTVANVQLTSPNGGENWTVGTSQTITWTQTGITEVRLEYTSNNGTSWNQIIGYLTASTGSYSWTVPNAVSTNCKVRITDVNNSSITDQSDAVFTISASTSAINLDYPNGGENWVVGNSYSIRWTQTGVTNVKLEYTTNNGTNWIQIVASTSASTGSYSWTIPNTVSTNCKVRITDVNNSSVIDQSNAVFTISVAPTITLTSPNGGENWTVGSVQTITWAYNGVQNVKLEYTINNGTSWNQIVGSISASTLGYSWTIPNTLSSNCKVRITDVGNNSITDQSDAFFTISAPAASISVTSPNGGENWLVGSSHNITWNQTGVANVKLEYTSNNGTSWTQIVASTSASTGSYSWTIPYSVSNNCKVRVTSTINSLISDVSNAQFTISAIPVPVVTVISPNGGENWFSGSQYSITWNSSNVQNLKLEYSVNGGTNWSLINASVPANLGSYIWTIPNTSSSTCKVKITSVENGTVFDESNSNFTISEAPTVILVSPNGGENWFAGSQYSITWNFVNVQKLRIEYSSNNGSDWNLIDSSVTANLGSYIWTVPNTPSTSCKVRITAVENGPVSDQSDGVFSISEPPSVQLSSPVGGEKWLSGKPYSIIWSFVNIENVKLEYSANNGLDWTTIEASFAALSGSYIWTVPAIESNQCLVRISAVNNPSVSDQSDAPFTIEPERTLSLTAPAGGEVFTSGNRMEIKWNSLNLETIDLYYSTDNGNNWHLITDSVSAALQSFYWDIPEINSNLVKIRTVYTRKSEIKSESAGTITILPSPKVVLQANISGAYLKSGTTYLLEWFVENVASVNIYFSSDEGATWNELAVNISSSVRSYNWMVPQLNSKNCRIKIASTTNPALLSVNPGNFTVYTYSASVSLTNTWQFGDIKDINNYRLVSIPGNTSENLGSIIPGKHINEWNAYWDNGEDNNYQVQYDGSDKFNFLPGKGFWVLSKNQVSLSKQTDAVMIDSTLIFRIPLHKGWNIIGNTFPKSVNWSEIRAVNSLPQNSLIYWWEGRWTFPSLMEPYKGYYYFNSDNRSQLKLIYPVEQSLTKTNRENFVALPEDRVTISFAENEITASFNGTASTGLDTNDYLLPNISFGGKSISFLQSSEAGLTRQLFVESQPKDSSGNSFRFRVVNTSSSGDLMEIAPSKNLRAENVWLLDEKYSEFIDITVKDKFSIVPQDDPRYYTLLIGSPEYINSIRSKFLPVEYILYQNYPNPFNPETSIKYALPQNSHVKINLFDILGNEVITLFEGEESAGVHTRTFDLSGFASGVYLYRLEAGDRSFVKKMVLLR